VIQALYHSATGPVRTDLTTDDFPAALADPAGVLWVDLLDEPAEVCGPILRDIFGFHPLAVDDALVEVHVPKVDDWGDYLYIVLHAVALDGEAAQALVLEEVDIFLGRNYLVTHRTQPVAAMDRVWATCQRDERHLHKGAVRLLYLLADDLVADYMPVVETFDEEIDEIESHVFARPRPDVVEDIFRLKRELLQMRRIIAPQREVLNKLARGDFAVVGHDEQVFFRDVYDHLVRLYDISESLRDLVGDGLDTYLSVVNNRLNEVVKTLTIITTLFMPLSFVASFFGMNFFQPVEPLNVWTGMPAFVITLLLMAAMPGVMYLWMRRRAWM
jgi:magnesium transporter